MLLKILKSFIKIKHNVTTGHLKTALLHTSSKIIKSNISSGKNCGEIKRTIDAANMILLQYLKFIEDKYLPSYFFKMNLLQIQMENLNIPTVIFEEKTGFALI